VPLVVDLLVDRAASAIGRGPGGTPKSAALGGAVGLRKFCEKFLGANSAPQRALPLNS